MDCKPRNAHLLCPTFTIILQFSLYKFCDLSFARLLICTLVSANVVALNIIFCVIVPLGVTLQELFVTYNSPNSTDWILWNLDTNQPSIKYQTNTKPCRLQLKINDTKMFSD